ncbi:MULTISPECIES: ABC transporter substrate-binding protein [Brenneria]|uniref:ABC transporter substrate-binding protein n=1 Tax=Brenneria nigrifluens DSM 30175 = ATCC 13028 TaxID=1121120 RepID=A0A2U1URP5_9GAMM|nr:MULTISPECIES: ABC transporter substrate-binding protein [Brenneria]EHD23050.1 ABC-type transporter, periplasmic subunit family 3 [Brenneria sp. EniD312]PWC24346.1 ABC transporter substrate-binding protein [Brenneria nigrifluens DSM 30175 = ATCC 13028]QCR05945.1 ABC transporter substrate-binding protein [Brenneria nigrifluens DSM 30175 = ATCC 13028]
MKIKRLGRTALLTGLLFSAGVFAAEAPKIAPQQVNKDLHARLPDDIKKAGVLKAVNNGSFPPYEIVSGTHSLDGASADLAKALGEILGVKIEHASVSGLSSLLSGIQSGRYQFGIGPIGDFPARQEKNDFVDFVREFVVFAVRSGNPEKINSLEDTCGKRVAVMSGGSAEQVIVKQSKACTDAGKPAVTIQSYADQPTSILSVRSGRADAFFSSQAPLTYFVEQTNGQLELAGTGQHNGFNDLYQGSVFAKDSPLAPIVLEAYQQLFDNGTYAAIMKKWHLQGNMLPAPGINLAGKQ